MIPTDYEWFEIYEDIVDHYFAEDGDEAFIEDDEDELDRILIS